MASFPMNLPDPGRGTTHRVVEGASNQRKSGRFVCWPRLSADGVGVQGGDGGILAHEGTKGRRLEGAVGLGAWRPRAMFHPSSSP